MLQQASNIATLTICKFGNDNIDDFKFDPSSTILTHSNLSTLDICCFEGVHIEWLLDSLALPALCNLRVF